MEVEQPQTSEKPVAEPKADVKDDMRQFAETLEKGEEQVDVDPEEDPKPVDEDSEKDLDDEQKEDDKDPEEKDDEKKRPNRYQKQKAKIEAQQVLIKKVSSERDDAIKIANTYRNRLLKVVDKYEKDFKALQAGRSPSDTDHELWSLKAKQQEAEELAYMDKKQQEERIKAEIDAARSEQAIDYRVEAFELAKAYGLKGDESKAFARKVLLYTATEWESGNTKLTLKEAAKEFGLLLRKKKTPEQEQFDVNSSAPSTIRRGGGKPPSYEIAGKSEEDQKKTMLAYIASVKGK